MVIFANVDKRIQTMHSGSSTAGVGGEEGGPTLLLTMSLAYRKLAFCCHRVAADPPVVQYSISTDSPLEYDLSNLRVPVKFRDEASASRYESQLLLIGQMAMRRSMKALREMR